MNRTGLMGRRFTISIMYTKKQFSVKSIAKQSKYMYLLYTIFRLQKLITIYIIIFINCGVTEKYHVIVPN